MVCEDDEKDYDSDHSSELEKIQREDRRRDAVWNRPVSTVHAVLIADVIVNGVSINVGELALTLVRRHLVRAALLLLLRLVGEVETLI